MRWGQCALMVVAATVAMACAKTPAVLVVTAHPDDETAFASTLYKMTHDLGYVVDMMVISNGEGGYSCSTYAEWIYHYNLTNESVARAQLPRIRKEETLCSADNLGVRFVYFLEQPDVEYTQNVTVVLDEWWDSATVRKQIVQRMTSYAYDYVVTMLPDEGQHGEHKAATILALQAVAQLRANATSGVPIILGETEHKLDYKPLDGYPVTAAPPAPLTSFDRLQPLGARLTYQMPVLFSIACHMGCLQMSLTEPQPPTEFFYYFDVNGAGGEQDVLALFSDLAEAPYKEFHGCE